MAVPKVGITAEFLLRDYLKNVKKYLRFNKSLETETKKTAAAVTKSTGTMAKSARELFDSSKFLQAALKNWVGTGEEAIAFTDLSAAWDKLATSGKVNVEMFDNLAQKGLDLGDALKIASGAVQFNAQTFQSAQKAGLSYGFALKAATGQIGSTMSAVTSLAAATSAYSLAVGTSIKVIKEAIQQYNDMAKEVRLIRLELGITSEEASAWVARTRLADTSTASLTTALGQLQRRIVDTNLRMIEGKTATTIFTRAMKLMDVSLTDVQDNLRPTTEIMDELFEKIRALGPGAGATEVAMAAFGRGAKNILPIIFETGLTLDDINATMAKYGTSIEENEALYQTWREATFELWAAKQGVANFFARTFIPAIADAIKIISNLINVIRKASIVGQGWIMAIGTFIQQKSLPKAIQAYNDRLEQLNQTTEKATQSERDLALARQNAIFDALKAAEAEEKLRELQDLADLQARHNEKLADIEVDFSDRWEDILIDRSRDAEERTIKMFQKLEDIWRKNQRKLEDISIRGRNRVADLERDRSEAVSDFQERSNKKREDLELKHQERLWKIQTRFLDTIEEAARRNDAVAVVAAMRRRRRELRDADRQRSVEQRDLGRDLNERRREINQDFDRRKQDALRQQAEEEARAQLAHERALEDFKIASERERVETLRKYRQQQQDFDRNKRRALRDARTWYRREQQELQVHMQTLNVIAVQGVIDTTQAVAAATSAGVQQIAAIAAMGLGSIGGGVVAQALSGIGGGSVSGESAALREWLNRNRGIIGGRAKGGIDIVNRPTTVTMGEVGSELHAFIPLHSAMNVSHQFGRLPIDLNGAQGMNPQEVRSIIYDAMTDFASKLMPRWTRRR